MSFGNMTVELNVFHTSSQPSIIDMIDVSVNHIFEESCYEDPLEKCLAHFEMNFNIEKSIEEVNTLLDSVSIMGTNLWRPNKEPLPLLTFVPVPSIIEPPKLELKPLPDMLRYDFLGEP